ncbi:MAG: uracil-DNA glycosylase [Opitutales bacterium]|nr:uracil-DNA glycosylase [Opitutales bacterium]
MTPEDATIALLEELKRQRVEGVREIFLQDDTLTALSNHLGPISTPVAKKIKAAIPYPSVPPLEKKETTSLPEPVHIQPVHTVPTKEKEISAFETHESKQKFPPPPELDLPAGSKLDQWKWLRGKVKACEVCNRELGPTGNIVFGGGSLDAELFFCGEAPGVDEEKEGEAFVGPAGDLLNRIIGAMGMSRESVYLANIMNWRPLHTQAFGNRPPSVDEMSFCLPYLRAQVEIVKPKVLVCLGKVATDALLGHDPKRRLSDCRGQWSEALGIPTMVTYHPSYLLHNPSKTSKRKVWDDLLLVMEKLGMPISAKQRGFFSS